MSESVYESAAENEFQYLIHQPKGEEYNHEDYDPSASYAPFAPVEQVAAGEQVEAQQGKQSFPDIHFVVLWQ